MNSKSTWIERVGKRGLDLKDAPTPLLGDEDVVCAAVKNNDSAFQYASPLLQNDKKFFMEKLIPLSEWSPYALKYASDELRKDKEVVKKAVHYNWGSFEYANSELKDDRDFVKELVQLKEITNYTPPAFALGYASKRVQNDKEVVLAAVKNDGGALQFASDELRNDKEVVREAVRDYGGHFQYASEELLNDREFCLECVKISKHAFEYVSEELKKEFGKTKEEFMKKKNEGPEKKVEKKKKVEKITKKKPISESGKNERKYGREPKEKENDTRTISKTSVVPKETKRAMESNSMEIEYQKQIKELKKALYRGEEERKAEVDALRVELENREKLTAKSGVEKQDLRKENKNLKKGNFSLNEKMENQKKVIARSDLEVKKLKEWNFSLNEQFETQKNVVKELTEKNKGLHEIGKQLQVSLKKVNEEKKEMEKEIKSVKKEKEDTESLFNFERTLVGTNLTDYVIKEEIHRGQNGVVCEAYLNRRKLSMKICYVFGYKMTPQLWKEKVRPEFLFKLPIHPNLLRIHYCGVGNIDRDTPVGHSNYGLSTHVKLNKNPFFVMEWCDGSLQDLVKDTRPVFPDLKEFKSFLVDVTNGLRVMKSYNVIHRDVKQDNIMFKIENGKRRFVVGDYGKSIEIEEDSNFILEIPPSAQSFFDRGGAPMFMPSEIKKPENGKIFRFDKYDVFSMGVVVFELFSKRNDDKFMLTKEECPNDDIRNLVRVMVTVYKDRLAIEELNERAKSLLET